MCEIHIKKLWPFLALILAYNFANGMEPSPDYSRDLLPGHIRCIRGSSSLIYYLESPEHLKSSNTELVGEVASSSVALVNGGYYDVAPRKYFPDTKKNRVTANGTIKVLKQLIGIPIPKNVEYEISIPPEDGTDSCFFYKNETSYLVIDKVGSDRVISNLPLKEFPVTATMASILEATHYETSDLFQVLGAAIKNPKTINLSGILNKKSPDDSAMIIVFFLNSPNPEVKSICEKWLIDKLSDSTLSKDELLGFILAVDAFHEEQGFQGDSDVSIRQQVVQAIRLTHHDELLKVSDWLGLTHYGKVF